jgi:biopolymer transport protein ExbB
MLGWMGWIGMVTQASPPAAGVAPGGIGGASGAAAFVGTVWDMVVKGGWMMVPLALCSLVAAAIVFDRWIVTMRSRIAPAALRSEFRSLRGSPEQALARARSSPSPLGRVMAVAIASGWRSRDERAKEVGEAGQREVLVLRQRMRLLSSLPQVATMLGLLGTVVGMIRTFTTVAASADALGKTERLAQGIYEAWTATAAGLVIAIPLLVAFQILMARIDAAAALLDESARAWLDGDGTPTTRASPNPEAPHDGVARRVGEATADVATAGRA